MNVESLVSKRFRRSVSGGAISKHRSEEALASQCHPAAILITYLNTHVQEHDLGIVLDGTGTLKILPTQIRVPDVSVILWERFPSGRLPEKPIPALAPDLAVEVLSRSNSPGEIKRKLRDYFQAGRARSA